MAFAEMIKKLKEDGLLDTNGDLTQKGHEYVIHVKKRYMDKIKPFNSQEKIEEQVPWVNRW